MSKEIIKEKEEKVIKGIHIGKDFVLYSDTMNLILLEFGIKVNPRAEDESKRESYGQINKTFHRTLQQVFNQIIERTTYKFNFEDLEGVNRQLEELKGMVKVFKNTTKLNGNTLSVIEGISD